MTLCLLSSSGDELYTMVSGYEMEVAAFNLILPCILITMLTLVGFTLPPDAGEKMSLRMFSLKRNCRFRDHHHVVHLYFSKLRRGYVTADFGGCAFFRFAFT